MADHLTKSLRLDWRKWLPPGILIVAGILAYHNSFFGPFIFDDDHAIVQNIRIQKFWPVWGVLAGTTRPVVDFTLAVNHALGGLNVVGYHVVNLLIHLAAGLALYGIVRRTLLLGSLQARYAGQEAWIGLAVALLWQLHPLQTQSVDYVIQRGESLMGLFYLCTLYCVIRGADAARGWGWYAAAACALGMGSKAVMVTAPLMVLLYDRIFLAGSFMEAFRRRWGLYAGLAATWGFLALLLAVAPNLAERGAGFGMQGMTTLEYASTQPGVITHYLRLVFWPEPLVMDYGWPVARTGTAIFLPLVPVLALLALMLWGLVRTPKMGFLGAWFFLTLAPTSSFLPLADPAFEYRMYLPLAAWCVLAVLFVWKLPVKPYLPLAVVAAAAIALGWTTMQRNEDYRSEEGIWRDAAAKRPENARAHNNLGNALYKQRNLTGAMEEYVQALRLKPYYGDALYNFGVSLADMGKFEEAETYYRLALKAKPGHVDAHNNLGIALTRQNRFTEASEEITEALRLKPAYPAAHNNMGSLLARQGKSKEAIPWFQEALRLDPDFPMAHFNLGVAYADNGNLDGAFAEYERALQLKPDYPEAHNNLGVLLFTRGDITAAKGHYLEAVRLKSGYADAHTNLGNALFREENWEGASGEYREALRLNPGLIEARNNLRMVMEELEKREAAVREE